MNKGQFKKGIIPWMKGKKHKPESLEKLSESMKGRIPWNRDKKGRYTSVGRASQQG